MWQVNKDVALSSVVYKRQHGKRQLVSDKIWSIRIKYFHLK